MSHSNFPIHDIHKIRIAGMIDCMKLRYSFEIVLHCVINLIIDTIAREAKCCVCICQFSSEVKHGASFVVLGLRWMESSILFRVIRSIGPGCGVRDQFGKRGLKSTYVTTTLVTK